MLKRQGKPTDISRTLGSNNSKPRQVTPQSVDRLCPLAHQKIPHSIPCCCSVFTATKLMVGRCAASQIASAASFFWRLTNGLTYIGGIKRTS